MTETYTFISDNKIFQTTIKSEFLKIIAKPETVPYEQLMTEHGMSQYLHNPHGPAVKVLRNNYEEYWLDGKKVSEEVEAKIKHNIKFHGELEDILNKPENT